MATKNSFPPSDRDIFVSQKYGEQHSTVLGKPVAIWYKRNKKGIVKQTHVACITKIHEDDGTTYPALLVAFAKTAVSDMSNGIACKRTGRAVACLRLAKTLKKAAIGFSLETSSPNMVGIWTITEDPDTCSEEREYGSKRIEEVISLNGERIGFSNGESIFTAKMATPPTSHFERWYGKDGKELNKPRIEINRAWVSIPDDERLIKMFCRLKV